MRLYLANKMTGIPFFNAPWFDKTADEIRSLNFVKEVFNPTDADREMGFDPMACPKGSLTEAATAGFDLRKALQTDWDWISRYSNGLVIGPDWKTSRGTISEIACHQALNLPVWTYQWFMEAQSRGAHFLTKENYQLPLLTSFVRG